MRKLNHIKPEQFPFTAPSGSVYDSGDFSALFDKALEAADWDGFAARKAESEARGMLRGRGIGNFLECTAPPMKEQGELVFEEDGSVTIVTGTLDYGQGHWTPFAQVLHAKLGVPFDKIRLVQGDSDRLIAGGGTGGSKSLMASGAAILQAADIVIEKGRKAAGYVLEAAADDIEFAAGRFAIAGTDRGIGIMELAASAARDRPPAPGRAEQRSTAARSSTKRRWPSRTAATSARSRSTPRPATSRIDRYISVNDFGVIVNPLLVEGQAHGGIVQGIGQALIERVAYSEDGQPLTGSYMDYGLPRADDLPMLRLRERAVPCKTNPLGAKGCGEAGCAGSLPAVMNAMSDALGGKHINMPATPERVWAALHAVRKTGEEHLPQSPSVF